MKDKQKEEKDLEQICTGGKPVGEIFKCQHKTEHKCSYQVEVNQYEKTAYAIKYKCLLHEEMAKRGW